MAIIDDTWDTDASAERIVDLPAGVHARIGVRQIDGDIVQRKLVDTRATSAGVRCIFVRRPTRTGAATRAAELLALPEHAGALGFTLRVGERIHVEPILPPADLPSTAAEVAADVAVADDAALRRVLRRARALGRLRAAAMAEGITADDVVGSAILGRQVA